MAAAFFPSRFGVKNRGLRPLHVKKHLVSLNIFGGACLHDSTRWLQYSVVLTLFLAISLACHQLAGINGDDPQVSDCSVSEAAAKSRKQCFCYPEAPKTRHGCLALPPVKKEKKLLNSRTIQQITLPTLSKIKGAVFTCVRPLLEYIRHINSVCFRIFVKSFKNNVTISGKLYG